MSNFHSSIMNIPATMSETGLKADMMLYQWGRADARHAAAEIALEADKRIEELENALKEIADNECEYSTYASDIAREALKAAQA